MESVCPLKVDRNMLQTMIPWVLPGHAHQPDISDVIHSVAILQYMEHFEQHDINRESCYLPTPLRIWIKTPIQFEKGRAIQ